MQATAEGSTGREDDLGSGFDISRDFGMRLKIEEDLEAYEEEEEEEEEEFSFMCGGSVATAITADDAFVDGKIKPIYPLLDRDFVFSSRDSESEGSCSTDSLPVMPSVKVFVEMREEEHEQRMSHGNDEVIGPVCEWSSRKSAEESRQICKKSNSTGSSKIRRIKELIGRSNSDGRDAFIFLHKRQPPPTQSTAPVTAKKVIKKSRQDKTTPLSPHEAYLKSKAKQEAQQRSYLPNRPEFMGIFTNIHGGLSKNLHPF